VPRFVILRHQSPHGEHFDFMLEAGGMLKTWALPRPPGLGAEMDCEALADHRIEYLDYEGPISGERGAVTQWDRGTYTLQRRDDTQWTLQLTGQILTGQATFLRLTANHDRWRFSLAPIDAAAIT
jgi:hypothetical protein